VAFGVDVDRDRGVVRLRYVGPALPRGRGLHGLHGDWVSLDRDSGRGGRWEPLGWEVGVALVLRLGLVLLLERGVLLLLLQCCLLLLLLLQALLVE
jgi:hypothetical protein